MESLKKYLMVKKKRSCGGGSYLILGNSSGVKERWKELESCFLTMEKIRGKKGKKLHKLKSDWQTKQ